MEYFPGRYSELLGRKAPGVLGDVVLVEGGCGSCLVDVLDGLLGTGLVTPEGDGAVVCRGS